jgi:hypothetical protein
MGAKLFAQQQALDLEFLLSVGNGLAQLGDRHAVLGA